MTDLPDAPPRLHNVLRDEIHKTIVGQDEAVELLLIATIAGGHVLLEGVPGVAKTLLARAAAQALGLSFKRIQFTPDLMPADVVGTQVYDFQAGRFHVVTGPVFTQVLLADEINRAPAKTQAALLEAMQERQVSLDGTTRALPTPFLVLATQNPIEQQGTYPLPEAQLDRFLFKVAMGYPSADEEEQILAEHRGDASSNRDALAAIQPVASAEALAEARERALAVTVQPELRRYLLALIRRTREDVHLAVGASPRAGVMLQLAARVRASLEERDYVVPDDIKRLLVPTLRHRVVPTAAAEVEGLDPDDILGAIGDSVDVPR